MFSVKKTRNIFSALFAGLLNGLLGTGGGVALWFAASERKDKKTAFATASAGVLILCLVSVLLYGESNVFSGEPFSASLWLAVLGGAIGASLLKWAPLSLLRFIFCFLLIGSGAYLIVRVAYDVLFA